MKGAIVFLAVFFIFLAATLAYPGMPPGKQIYDGLNLPADISYQVLGMSAATLIIAVFNGVIYGIIAWITFTILEKRGMLK
jgi:hypothetical protein